MPKMKTNKETKKRYSLTATGVKILLRNYYHMVTRIKLGRRNKKWQE